MILSTRKPTPAPQVKKKAALLLDCKAAFENHIRILIANEVIECT